MQNASLNRRLGWRARTDFAVTVQNGCFRASSRAIELSTTGIVLDRGHGLSERDCPLFLSLELRLPERRQALRSVGRPVWWFGSLQALTFVGLTDVDRLTLAEHLDILHRGRRDFRSVAPWVDFRKALVRATAVAGRRREKKGFPCGI